MNLPMRPLPSPEAKRREKEIYQLAHYVTKHPGSSTSDVKLGAAAISATCRTSHFHYLDDAVTWGWLLKTGVTKGVKYYPTPQFKHHVAMRALNEPLAKREKVGYNEDFLRAYVPNQTFYLSDAQRAQLKASCAIGTFDARDAKISHQVRRFMSDISHNSSAFEGVHVQYADTISFLEDNIESRNMSPIDAVILRNHYNAIKFIVDNTHYPPTDEDVRVSEYDTRNIHAFLSNGLLADPRMEGRLRHEHVEIRESCYIPTNQPDIIARAFSSILHKASEIENPYEQAVFLLVHIPYLQPFSDCNKRTARLICNVPLLNHGILPISWAEVNQRDYTDSLLCIYENNSTYGLCDVFVDACKRSFERFEITLNRTSPARIVVDYPTQVKEAIRARILQGERLVPSGVRPEHINDFHLFIESRLDIIRENEISAGPYRIRPDDVKLWMEREQLDANRPPTEQRGETA